MSMPSLLSVLASPGLLGCSVAGVAGELPISMIHDPSRMGRLASCNLQGHRLMLEPINIITPVKCVGTCCIVRACDRSAHAYFTGFSIL